jgi:hypothetical protein
MPNLIINKVPSASGTPGNLVIDKYVPTTFTPSTVGEIYWRWEDEPTATPTLLTAQRQDTTVSETFDLGGRAIRLFLVSRTRDGDRSVSDVRLAEQVVFTPDPTLGILTDLGSTISDLGNVLTNE